MPSYFPVLLNLEGRRCLVIGGGLAAAEKALGLSAAGARVTVLASSIVEELGEAVMLGHVVWVRRDYRPGDLDGYFLVVATTGSEQNEAIFVEAEERGVLMNALDDPRHCRFIFPSVHRQGDLVLAVSTSGVAPALAVRLRERFGAELGPQFDSFLQLARQYRGEIARQLDESSSRRELWYRIVDSEIVDFLRDGRMEEARGLFESLLRSAGVEPAAAS
ncbi:MAG: bifunctional precorrin-2 dehydrogenase/sirohydrochlorin ferrochelatase [Bryobacterales bacterium]|nr:bifunctional precorrin-2 dehydrogenase/sirohydrochlorin ferrochelatase [Bryobacterales bacterium]